MLPLVGRLKEIAAFVAALLGDFTSLVEVCGVLEIFGYLYFFCQAKVTVPLAQLVHRCVRED